MKPFRPVTAPRRFGSAQLLLALNAMGLLSVAVWMRCRSLGNIPGINGDEAWYGVQALGILWEHRFHVQTPTLNPPNLFFLGPVVLLHLWLPPSIVLLRSVAVAGGLAALAVNWLLCRWVFDHRTAAISTVVLAILPINIAYSRFAWDASQSVAATLPVLYFSLAAVRFPRRQRRFLVAAILSQVVAALVHPTNIFAGAAITAALATRVRWRDVKRVVTEGSINCRVAAGLSVGAILLFVLALLWMRTPGPSRFVRRMGDLRELILPRTTPHFSVLYPRLLTGGTIYRYISGSRSWFEWPCAEGREGWGIDVVLFWAVLGAAMWFLWRSWHREGRREDRVLLAAWSLELMAFLLIAGPRAMMPGWERFAVCLVGPTVVLGARGAALCCARPFGGGLFQTTTDGRSGKRRLAALASASLAGWLLLADFHVHYFRFIQQTGGRSHETFRTAAVEPKAAALRAILRQRGSKQAWIVASDWHICWPLRYLAMGNKGILVHNPREAAEMAKLRAVPPDRVWRVEFSGSKGLRQARADLADPNLRQWQERDYGGRSVLHVLHGK